jgi:penicillin-binding protein 1A
MSFLKNITLAKIILILWAGFISILFFVFLYFYLLSINFLGLFGELPDLNALENPRSELASEMYSADNVLIGKYFRENRSKLEFEEISPNLLNALIATEDVRFEEHSGIDLKGIIAIGFYLAKGDNRGSSTLSQQLAKNLFDTRSQRYEGHLHKIPGVKKIVIKTKEWITAVILEKSYTKKEIVTMYLNTVDFGSNAYGLRVATETFFGKSADSLKIEEAAVLVGILKAPSYYSPIFNNERSRFRRNTVLEQMLKYKFISKNACDSLKAMPLALNYSVENHNSGSATYFRSVIRDYLMAWCKENGYDLYADGLKIYTTIDSRLQKHAEDAVNQHMKFLQAQFYEHWKGKSPWVDENFKELPGFIDNVMKRTDRYRSLKAQYNDNKDSIMAIMNKPLKMKVFSWNGERDTIMSPLDSIKYYKYFLQCGFMSMEPAIGAYKSLGRRNKFQVF